MKKCITCGEPMGAPEFGDRPYDALEGVTLCGVEVRVCPTCGAEEVSIPAVNDLNRVIARALAEAPGKRTGPEFRFLRKHLGWSSKALAKILGVTPETVSRWENEHAQVGDTAERLLRVLVLRNCEPILDYEEFERVLERMSDSESESSHMVIRHSGDGWTEERAA